MKGLPVFKKVLVLAIVMSLAACSAKTGDANASTSGDPGTLAVTAAFTPDPPTQGSDTITVTLKDASGNPVHGAQVKIATNMPTMSMKGPDLTPKDNGDGTYTTSAKLDYNTKWSFVISADANGQHATTTVEKDVH
jgi:YtkA-like/Invasin, domain 3